VCTACGRESTSFVEKRTGEVVFSRSKYPDEYVFSYDEGEERVTSADVRVAVLAQTTIHSNRDTMLAAARAGR